MSEHHTRHEAELEELLREYSGLLRGLVEQKCPPGIDAAEVEQRVRLKLWKALESETEVRHPSSYLYRIVTSVVIDAIRSLRRRRETSLEAEENEEVRALEAADPRPSPEDRTDAVDTRRAVRAALQELAPNRRRAVALHLDGFSNGEIATMMNWSEHKVRNLVWRGVQDLRQRLQEAGVVP